MLHVAGYVVTMGVLFLGLAVAVDCIARWRDEDDAPEPDEVDGVELPNVIDLRVQGGSLRSARARLAEAERRAGLKEPA